MNILKAVEALKASVVEHGDYRAIASKSGVGYHWLAKFAAGSIKNPGVLNVAKVSAFFNDKTTSQ